MLYQHSDEDDDTAPLLVPTILPSATTTTTRSSRSSKRIVIVTVVAAMTMLVVTGGTVWLRNGSSYTTAAEGLVVATHDNADCIAPIDATFGGTSTTTTSVKVMPSKPVINTGTRPNTVGQILTPQLIFFKLYITNVFRKGGG